MKKRIQIKISPCHSSGCWALVSHWEASSSVSGDFICDSGKRSDYKSSSSSSKFSPIIFTPLPLHGPLKYPWRGLPIILYSDSCLGPISDPALGWLQCEEVQSVYRSLLALLCITNSTGDYRNNEHEQLKQRMKIVSQRELEITFRVKYKVQRLMGQERY
jgi:hypothetical protein